MRQTIRNDLMIVMLLPLIVMTTAMFSATGFALYWVGAASICLCVHYIVTKAETKVTRAILSLF